MGAEREILNHIDKLFDKYDELFEKTTNPCEIAFIRQMYKDFLDLKIYVTDTFLREERRKQVNNDR